MLRPIYDFARPRARRLRTTVAEGRQKIKHNNLNKYFKNYKSQNSKIWETKLDKQNDNVQKKNKTRKAKLCT